VLSGHSDGINSVAWSGDGARIATAADDETVRIWGYWPDTESLIALARECCFVRALTDEESVQFGIPPATSMPPPQPIVSCPDAPPSRLYPGVRGIVTDEDQEARALNVRRNPGVNSARQDQILPNQTFWVIAGPECDGEFAWFRIRYSISSRLGWIAEGDSDNYFVRPVLP